ncbi:MAG: ThiF family adenylyltransferase [Rubrivivax sp.]
MRRLYGDAGYAKLRAARIAVVGVGGVGSWAAEALARSGVAQLVLVDLDHVAESNINRQVQALTPTLRQAKVRALAERIALIHPGCQVHAVEEFAEAGNWPALLTRGAAGASGINDAGGTASAGSSASAAGDAAIDVVIDACDDVRAKEVLARWSLEAKVPCIIAGAAGGKRLPEAVQVAGLADVTHDPLLAALRQRLRRAGVMARGDGQGKRRTGDAARCLLSCVFSREPVAAPATLAALSALAAGVAAGEAPACEPAPTNDGSLNCAGYGSSVMVTATFGFVAAAAAVSRVIDSPGPPPSLAGGTA